MKKLLMGLVAVTLVFVACDNNVNGTGGGEEENVTPPTGPSGIPISGVMITPSTVTMLKLTQDAVTEQLAFTILPPTHTQETTVTWSSSDEEVATVDASGMITAVGGGTATVTITTDGRMANGNHATANATITVLTTDPAIFRWSAETCPYFADIVAEAPSGHPANIAINTYRMINGVPMLTMGQELIATVSVNGHKGFLLNAAARGERDPETGLHLEGGAHIRSPNSRLIIGATDFGTWAPNDEGNYVYTNLSNPEWAPTGVLDLNQNLSIRIGFSDMTSGVADGASDFEPRPQYGFQVFVLNNSTGMANSPLGGASRVLSDVPNLPPPSGDGYTDIRFNGPNASAGAGFGGNIQAVLENGFISIFSGFGRQMIVRSVVIEPL